LRQEGSERVLLGAKEARDEFLPEKMCRSWVQQRLKNFFAHVMVRYEHRWETHALEIAASPRRDGWMVDSENDAGREALR